MAIPDDTDSSYTIRQMIKMEMGALFVSAPISN